MRFLKIPDEFSIALGEYLQGQRVVVTAVLNILRDSLENHYDSFKDLRNDEDISCFDFQLSIFDLDCRWHTFHFVVDDSMAGGYLLIVALSHRLGELSP